MEAVVEGVSVISDLSSEEAKRFAYDQVEFLPGDYIQKSDDLLKRVGQQIVQGLKVTNIGAPTNSYKKATNTKASPLGGLGFLRLGEDGRLYLAAKSEHYHTPLGHNFPGYKLIDNARALGITNATHNNTRGYITRLLERELVRTANGLDQEDSAALDKIIDADEPHVLNRVINLETGSLACEAGIKMMLSKFYKLDASFPEPKYGDRIPVFFVMADNNGGGEGNYHGTTVIAQVMRDMWPGLYGRMQEAGILKICPVTPNDFEDFKTKFEKYNKPPYKAAGFLHEIIMMNYGGIRLEKEFLQKAYRLCHSNDTPVMCDEIQSCMWYSGMYLFRDYGLDPDFVAIGKGFPGGQYPASRIITTAEMDTLTQFGALVTNAQEELAALAYLITMKFSEENASYIRKMGEYYESRLEALASSYPLLIKQTEGKGHLSTIYFHKAEDVKTFTRICSENCIDISAQTYKANCPPAALTKPPTIATKKMLDYLIDTMNNILEKMTLENQNAVINQ
ncbi:aminotransferase class III-fold pyridoxal phosphate-dependent enzyme [Bacillus infantis]|uniref:aminotransferase class III-fold pyridoxal phosphate-dependent enzyme n=1 Tax=Bacillus infantis TaxID=324767 RepID=UPI001F10F11B|nr:aminotransferase class III-fold pyridoxal phosphate-dependent enzyme [Bacillus infantis]